MISAQEDDGLLLTEFESDAAMWPTAHGHRIVRWESSVKVHAGTQAQSNSS